MCRCDNHTVADDNGNYDVSGLKGFYRNGLVYGDRAHSDTDACTWKGFPFAALVTINVFSNLYFSKNLQELLTSSQSFNI